jgi:hypothetical protein
VFQKKTLRCRQSGLLFRISCLGYLVSIVLYCSLVHAYMYRYHTLQHSCPVVAVLSMFIVLSCHCKLVHVMCTFIPFLPLQSCSPQSGMCQPSCLLLQSGPHFYVVKILSVWSNNRPLARKCKKPNIKTQI